MDDLPHKSISSRVLVDALLFVVITAFVLQINLINRTE